MTVVTGCNALLANAGFGRRYADRPATQRMTGRLFTAVNNE